MAIKDLLDEFKKSQAEKKKSVKDEAGRRGLEEEALLDQYDLCFDAVILPVLKSVEKDLKEFGYYHSFVMRYRPETQRGRKHILGMRLDFYPEKEARRLDVREKGYRAVFAASEDAPEIAFMMNLNPAGRRFDLDQLEDGFVQTYPLEAVDRRSADDFLRLFVKTALAHYVSSGERDLHVLSYKEFQDL